MLDTIIYIPTILAYIFITLLVVILCFITIYVSHKIFLCIFDTLPVSHTPSLLDSGSSTPPADSRSLRNSARMTALKTYDSSVAALFRQEQLPARRAKTALRIIVTLEPCYVAFVTFVYTSIRLVVPPPDAPIDANGKRPSVRITETIVVGKKLVKYFDRLTDIPLGKVMQVCAPIEEERPSENQSTDTTLDNYEEQLRQQQQQQQQQQTQQQQQQHEEVENDVDLLFKDMFRAPRQSLAARLIVTRRNSRQ